MRCIFVAYKTTKYYIMPTTILNRDELADILNNLPASFEAKVFDLEELGWDFSTDTDSPWDVEEEDRIRIDIDEDGYTYYIPVKYDRECVRVETGDDKKTIADLYTLAGAHQLDVA